MWKNDMYYFKRHIFGKLSKEDEKDRANFYKELDWIKKEAVHSESRWEDFYHYTVYTLPNGHRYEYMEDNDYMIPYSIKRLSTED